MIATCRIYELGAAGCPVEVKKKFACSDERNERPQNPKALNGVALLRTSRRPRSVRWNSFRCVAGERSLCCAGDTVSGLASHESDEREKPRLCQPATERVPRQLRFHTAGRFSVARLFDPNASEHLVLTEGTLRGFPLIAPVYGRRAPIAQSRLKKSRSFEVRQ
jgi:hypothetical protein